MIYNNFNFRFSILFFLSLSSLFSLFSFDGGDGSSGSPYQISTCLQLQNMTSNLTAYYELVSDVDCSGFTNFERIGYCVGSFCDSAIEDIPFGGSLDGNEYTISNLQIVNLSINDSGHGLFGYINDSFIRDLTLSNFDFNYTIISSSKNYFGLLTGYSRNSQLTNVHVDGVLSVNDSGFSFTGDGIGGLSGFAELSTINNTSSNIIINAGGSSGGLVGFSDTNNITNSNSISSISSTEAATNFGGLLASTSYSTISNSYSITSITTPSADRVGGLIGNTYQDDISNSYSKGTIVADVRIGGLVGNLYSGGVSDSYSISNLTGDALVGGLVGFNYADISNSYSNSNVIALSTIGGGLIGEHGSGTISNSFASSNVSGSGNLGGFVGYNSFSGVITNSYWHNFTGNPNAAIGLDNNAQTVTPQTSLNYFYNSSNVPLTSWDSQDWTFSSNTLPKLSFEDISLPTGSVETSISSIFPLGFNMLLFTILFSFFILN